MPVFRSTQQRRRVSRALLSLLDRQELAGSPDPVREARQLANEGLTGAQRWLLDLALWIEGGSDGELSPEIAGWDLLDPQRQHAVAGLMVALAEDALAYDQDPEQGGAAVDWWLRERANLRGRQNA